MQVVYDETMLEEFMEKAIEVSPDHPVLIDKFLDDASEVDVDAICDGKMCVIGGIMEHIEEAGIHSGDSAMVLPPFSLKKCIVEQITDATKKMALSLNVIGLLNIQFAVKDDIIYVLEVNPRASRTVPFVSKTIGVPLAKLATRIMLGKSLSGLGFVKEPELNYFAVKESVFPFNRFSNVDAVLGPEMRSTGEVIGIDRTFEMAYAKSQLAAGQILPLEGNVFVSVQDKHKDLVYNVAKGLSEIGFKIIATKGTGKFLSEKGLDVKIIGKLYESERPNIIDYIKNNQVNLIINTPTGKNPKRDIVSIRTIAVHKNIPLITTIRGAIATMQAIKKMKENKMDVMDIKMYHTLNS